MDIVQIISSLGFPIAACVGMGVYCVKITKERHDESMSFIQALDNNTKVLEKLYDRMGDSNE